MFVGSRSRHHICREIVPVFPPMTDTSARAYLFLIGHHALKARWRCRPHIECVTGPAGIWLPSRHLGPRVREWMLALLLRKPAHIRRRRRRVDVLAILARLKELQDLLSTSSPSK